MGNGPFGAQPGEREIEYVGIEQRIRIPWLRFTHSIVVEAIIAGAGYGLICLLIMVLATISASGRGNGFWRVIWQGACRTWTIVRWGLWIPVAIWLIMVIVHGLHLLSGVFVPQQLSPNWPAASAAQDPAFSAETYAQAQERIRALTQALEPEETERVIRVVLEERIDGRGTREQIAFLPDSREMIQFARAVANGQSFSERTAKRFGLGGEWEGIRDQMLDRGWAIWRDGRHPQQGIELLAAGRAVMRRVVEAR